MLTTSLAKQVPQRAYESINVCKLRLRALVWAQLRKYGAFDKRDAPEDWEALAKIEDNKSALLQGLAPILVKDAMEQAAQDMSDGAEILNTIITELF
jgi:hypothetical protein